jgi:hypothetical protein
MTPSFAKMFYIMPELSLFAQFDQTDMHMLTWAVGLVL